MYFLKTRLKDALRSLLSKNYIQQVDTQKILKSYGIKKIKRFVQIGSNDGMKNDPLRENILNYKWQGILIEPNSSNFAKLKNNYSGATGLIFENVGIGEQNSEMKFYFLDNIQPDEPGWYDQICSFDHETFLKNIGYDPALMKRMRESKVPMMRFDTLMEKHGYQQLDLLHIDTEGYDFKILNTIDLKKYQPAIIIFEVEWLTGFELRSLVNLLKGNGYQLYKCDFDYIAVKKA